jgi:hypothetical protein
MIRLLIFFLVLPFWSTFSIAQEKQSGSYIAAVGFYNVENLFDTLNTVDVDDEEFTPTGKNQWNSQRYFEKLDRLSEVIAQLGMDLTPDGIAVLGLAEIENKSVIQDLISTDRLKNRGYQIVHYDSPDKRGVDVGLIYSPKYFKVESSKSFTLKLEGRDDFFTRDQLLVSGDFHGERVHFIVAHWPSRRGGEKKSSPLREAAADLARSIIDSILVAEGPKAKVIFMGDLNDDPVNKSMTVHMKSVGQKEKVKEGNVYNPFEDFYKKGIGTLAYQDAWNLFDQIVMTPAFIDEQEKGFVYYKAKVFNKPFLMQSSGRFKGYPFRSFAGGQYLGGYSDHFPTYIYLKKQLN